MLEAVEDLVDRRERLQLDIRLVLAPGGEGERFGHVLSRADEGTADGDAVRHHIEERNREFARRQPDQDAGATLPRHATSLLECGERGCRNQNAMRAAASLLLHGGRRIASLRIDY